MSPKTWHLISSRTLVHRQWFSAEGMFRWMSMIRRSGDDSIFVVWHDASIWLTVIRPGDYFDSDSCYHVRFLSRVGRAS